MAKYSLHVSLLLLTLFHGSVHGAFRFANYYQDHMVLQRAPQRATVWGYIDTVNASVTLAMNGKVYETRSSVSYSDIGNETIWTVILDPEPAEGPFQVKVTAKLPNGTLETIVLDDILFGDVWVCSGQSNMQFAVNTMFNASVEIANANNYPKIRLFTLVDTVAYTPLEEPLAIGMKWSPASNVTVSSSYTSAVCWLYGRMIQESLGGRPIGLVHSSWGGTNIEYWVPPKVLNSCAANQTEGNSVDSDLEPNAVLNNTVLYNAMIHPFTRMVIKGAIWYQGENNAGHNRDKYNCTFSGLIQTWREIWYARTNGNTDPVFPFGFVQLSTATNNSAQVGGFPWIRWHQTFDVGYVPNSVVPNVFMAVTLDLRDDQNGVHPRDKLDVGYRLSRSGLAVAYGFQNVTYLGPIIENIVVATDSSKVNVTYSNVASPSIELRNPNGFEVCCGGKDVCSSNDTVWVAAPASQIEGTQLSISLAVPSSCVSKTLNGLRYLWHETPCQFKQAAVYNSLDSDLPAPPYLRYF